MEFLMLTKRALSATLALLLAVTFAAPSGARAASADGFEYTVTGGVATVTGCTSTCPVSLVIPSTLGSYPVTSIDNFAFQVKALTTVTIPDSVTSIGIGAFSGNYLTTVTIPSSVTSISEVAFFNNLLTSVTIPSSVTSIGQNAFQLNSLTTVTIPDSVMTIDYGAFFRNLLTTVTIGSSVTSIGDYAFGGNELTTVTIPSSVTSIGDTAFSYNDLTSVTFLGNAPTAGDNVFQYSSSLTSVTRPYTATGWGSTWSGVPVVIADTQATPTVKPKVTGTAKVAKTLTAAKGTWTGSPEPTFTYQWYACTKAVSAAIATIPQSKKCKQITGATGNTFKLKSKQRGKYVAVLVTGTSLGTAGTTWLSKTTTKVK
jgi:hypothetical protein